MTSTRPLLGIPIPEELFLPMEHTKRVLNHIVDLALHVNRYRPEGCTLVGPAQIGKTFILLRAAKILREHWGDLSHDPHPIVFVSAPVEAVRREFWQATARVIRIPYDGRANWSSLRERTKEGLVKAGAKVIFIDELNNLTTGPYKRQYAVLDDIRVLSNELGIPVFASGTRAALNALVQNDQNFTRFQPIAIPFLEFNREFISLVKGFEEQMQVRPGTFSSKAFATRLFELSLKKIGRVTKLLNGALQVAERKGEDEITVSHLEIASLADIEWIPIAQAHAEAKGLSK